MPEEIKAADGRKAPESISYYAHEEEVFRMERNSKRLFAALIVAVVLVFASNCIWLYCWMQYDYVSDTVTVDSRQSGNANYIGQNGEIYNGTDKGTQNNKD